MKKRIQTLIHTLERARIELTTIRKELEKKERGGNSVIGEAELSLDWAITRLLDCSILRKQNPYHS